MASPTAPSPAPDKNDTEATVQVKAEERDPSLDPAAYTNFRTRSPSPSSTPPVAQSMPHRVEPYPSPHSMSATTAAYPAPAPLPAKKARRALASPQPPIATLPSPSPSMSSSAEPTASSTPPARRSPPASASAPGPPPPQAYAYDGRSPYYMYAPPPPGAYPPPPHDERGHPHYQHYPPPPFAHAHYAPYPIQHPHIAQQMPPPAAPGPTSSVQVIHTDDAATKLSDRVRRRCFNCCTTDTSTWRRSNLSPGKVLCNKCGLFERTHSRPRPEQFPHKRGPLATSTLRTANRSPPQAQAQQPYPAPPQQGLYSPPQPQSQPQQVYPPPPTQQTPPHSHPGTPKISGPAPTLENGNGVAVNGKDDGNKDAESSE